MMSALQSNRPAANGIYKNNITQVYELATKHRLLVEFSDFWEQGPAHCKMFNVCMKVGPLCAVGQGCTKKEARARAADAILGPLKQMPLPENVTQTPAPVSSAVAMSPPQPQTFKKDIIPCGRLSEVVQARGLKYPEYSLVDSRRVPEGRLFTMKVTVEGDTVVETGPTKKAAKNNAAVKMLALLGVDCPQYSPLLPKKDTPATPQVNHTKEVDEVGDTLNETAPKTHQPQTSICGEVTVEEQTAPQQEANKKDSKNKESITSLIVRRPTPQVYKLFDTNFRTVMAVVHFLMSRRHFNVREFGPAHLRQTPVSIRAGHLRSVGQTEEDARAWASYPIILKLNSLPTTQPAVDETETPTTPQVDQMNEVYELDISTVGVLEQNTKEEMEALPLNEHFEVCESSVLCEPAPAQDCETVIKDTSTQDSVSGCEAVLETSGPQDCVIWPEVLIMTCPDSSTDHTIDQQPEVHINSYSGLEEPAESDLTNVSPMETSPWNSFIQEEPSPAPNQEGTVTCFPICGVVRRLFQKRPSTMNKDKKKKKGLPSRVFSTVGKFFRKN